MTIQNHQNSGTVTDCPQYYEYLAKEWAETLRTTATLKHMSLQTNARMLKLRIN